MYTWGQVRLIREKKSDCYDALMLRDVVPFNRVWKHLNNSQGSSKVIASFIGFLERRFKAEFLYDVSALPLGNPDMIGITTILEDMKKAGVLLDYGMVENLPDEPPLKRWYTIFRGKEETRTGAATFDDDVLALTKAAAEAMERHVWYEQDDFVRSPTMATFDEMLKKGATISPRAFVGFSDKQRMSLPRLSLTDNSVFLWIRGYSWTQGKDIWVPAQTAYKRAQSSPMHKNTVHEPLIRQSNSTGLATHVSRESALLLGTYEIIERDAYMIMWLNQLSLPRYDSDALAAKSPRLKKLVENCIRYRLKVHFVNLLTDAPVHAICTIVEDMGENLPRITVGIAAYHTLLDAAEKSLLEALRARRGARLSESRNISEGKKPSEIGHLDRLDYWIHHDRYKKLRFMYDGPIVTPPKDSNKKNDAANFQEIIAWARTRGHEIASVSLTGSKVNVTPWHIEMMVMPDMQPLYFNEALPCATGPRVQSIPQTFGYMSRATPYTEEPHPFF